MYEALENRLLLHAMVDGTGLLVTGTEGADQIYLLGNRDQITVYHYANGGRQHGAVQRLSAGEAGRIRIESFGGNDRIVLSSALSMPEAITIDAGEGNDYVSGSAGRDIILGQDGSDRLYGRGGDDMIVGGPGNDRIVGGDGHDALRGLDGNDTLLGGDGDDRLYGGDGADVLLGQNNNDSLFGEAGNDWLYGGRGDDFFSGGDHDHYDLASSGGGNDRHDGTVERLYGFA